MWIRTSVPLQAERSGGCSSGASTRSTPSGRSRVLPGRTIARTRQPDAWKRRATCHPMNPVAPVIATVRVTRASLALRESRQRLLIQPVGFVSPRARLLGGLIDVDVVLEHPRELDAPILLARN